MYKWNNSYCPYFTPIEIIEFQNYYDEDSNCMTDEIKEVQENYIQAYLSKNGSKFDSVRWNRLVLEFQHTAEINESDRARQQQVLIGWNPEIKYTPDTQKKAVLRIESTFDSFDGINENTYPDAMALMEAVFPIQFNKSGDVLLHKPKFMIDFNEEYFSSHKILLNYEKNNNIEGIKYELARLYYMNYIIEKRLYSNSSAKMAKREENIKTRARILNDFNKYLKWILKREPEFNFGKYYEESQFYPLTVEIKRPTLGKIKDVFNSILLL